MSRFEYRGFYQNYDMEGEITIGTGKVKVHDIFEPLPDFMKTADGIFVGPPCNNGNLKSFYTKSDKILKLDYPRFEKRLFEVIDEINPKHLFI